MSPSPIIRPAAHSDDDAIWRVIEPILRAGETYPLPRDISRADAFAYWRAPGHEVYVTGKDRTPEWRGTSNSPGSFTAPA